MAGSAASPGDRLVGFCRAVARWLAGQPGWRRPGLAVALGGVMTLALPPVHLLPAMALAMTGLLWMSQDTADGVLASGASSAAAAVTWRRRLRRGFALGWWFGLGYFALGLYWINGALLMEGWRFAWLIPLSVVGVGGGLAVFSGLAVAAATAARPGWPRLLALAGAWTGMEVARGHLLTSFPWNLAGHALVFSDSMMQPAALVGVYGLSLLVVLWAGAPALLLRGRWSSCAMLLVGLPLALSAFGQARMRADLPPTNIIVRLVQPAVPQREKWHPERRFAHLDRLIDLTTQPPTHAALPPTIFIWPEAATAFDLTGDIALRRAITGVLPADSLLIAGTLRQERPAGGGQRMLNSIVALNPAGDVLVVYDKHHLVPFGEYVPFASVPGVAALARGQGSLTAGPGRRTVMLDGVPSFSPLVCYEAIFPGRVTAADGRPQWLLNLTNDAWFGQTAGPHQHLAAVRLRAVEEGLPLVRVANTGISAVVDPWGRVVAQLDLADTPSFRDVPLPTAQPPTLFARHGLASPLALAGLVLLVGWAMTAAGQGRLRDAT